MGFARAGGKGFGADEALRLITDIGRVDARLVGTDYLQVMLCKATAAFGLDYGIIGCLAADDPTRVDTQVMVAEGAVQDNFSYALRGTPCEHVYEGDRVCCFGREVARLFPEDQLLEDMGIEAYFGAPLAAPDGTSMGIFAFMHRAPLEPSDSLHAVLEYLASRAAMELMRESIRRDQLAVESQRRRQSRLTALGQVASGVAHDFNNLLASLQGHVDLLQRKVSPSDEVSRHLEGINTTIQRAQSTTRTLLDFSSDAMRRSGSTRVAAMFAELADVTTHTFPDTVSVIFDVVADDLAVEVEAGHLHQILLNLLLNARDALADGGRIEVHVVDLDAAGSAFAGPSPTTAYVGLQVVDSGCGIDPDVIERIFDPFFSTKSRDRGTGLGLTGVHQLVTAYGGSISVASDPGQGATFTLVLPRTASASVAADADDAMAVNQTRGSRILLAEDDESVADLFCELLSLEGYTVDVAVDGVDAEGRYRHAEEAGAAYDLLVTDINMPGKNGFELLFSLRERRPQLRAVVCTGDTSSPEAKQLETLEGCTLLGKPYSIQQLMLAIEQQLAGGEDG